jgi:hypothetical protein
MSNMGFRETCYEAAMKELKELRERLEAYDATMTLEAVSRMYSQALRGVMGNDTLRDLLTDKIDERLANYGVRLV